MKFNPLSLVLAALPFCANAFAAEPLVNQLKTQTAKIVYETYINNNWELMLMNADGSNPVNLTQSPTVHEHYPQVSPDGTKIAFSVDTGEGRDTVRSLWVMDSDGKNRRKLADGAREPFWAPDSKTIGFLPQEFAKFAVIDYSTKGMSFCDLATGKIQPHPNSEKLHHLYNPTWAPNGKWIAATVHAGMGFDHAILLIERNGTNIFNTGIPGCRPCISPDGKEIAWGPGDHEIATAPVDLDSDHPTVGPRRLRITTNKETKIYHVDWSPKSDFLSISRGPESDGDLTKPGTFQSACEIVGVYAKDWNIIAVSAKRNGVLDLNSATDADVAQLTKDGSSNKESDWFQPPAKK